MSRPSAVLSILVLGLLATPGPTFAQGGDLTLFIGSAYPVDHERFTLRPSTPSLPGADITANPTPELRAAGGLVVAGALAFELGVLGIEGRWDSMSLGFDVDGGRYDIRATSGPLQGLTGAVTVGDGRLDAKRLNILSINARLRTPGPVGIYASGGFSVLPDVTIEGSVPLGVELVGVPVGGIAPRLRLDVAPGESNRRYGLNGGAGLRLGSSRVALVGEVRVFYFKDYDLRFAVEDAPAIAADLIDRIAPVRFDPIIVNAQAGLAVRF